MVEWWCKDRFCSLPLPITKPKYRSRNHPCSISTTKNHQKWTTVTTRIALIHPNNINYTNRLSLSSRMTTRSEKSQSLIHQQQPNTNNKNNRLLHNRSIDSSPSQLVDHMTTSKAVAFCWNKVHQKHSLGNRSTTNICTVSTDWFLHNDSDTKKEESTTTHDKPVLPATGEVLCTATIATETKRRQTVLAVRFIRCYQSMAAPTVPQLSGLPSVPSLKETQFRPLLLCPKYATRP